MTTPKVTIGETELTPEQIYLLRAVVQVMLDFTEQGTGQQPRMSAARLREINELLSN